MVRMIKVVCGVMMVFLAVSSCTKKDEDTKFAKKKEGKMEERKIIEGPAKYQGVWGARDHKMAKFVGHKGDLKYPDYFMDIDVEKGECKIRFVYDTTETVYKVKIKFFEDTKDETRAQIINDRGDVRELVFYFGTYLETNGDKQQLGFKFPDSKDDEVIVKGKYGVIEDSVFGLFAEGRWCYGWDDLDTAISKTEGMYEVMEAEANMERFE